MMMKFFYLIMLFQVSAWAQDNTPFDFLTAHKSMKTFSKFSGSVSAAETAKAQQCEVVNGNEGESVLSCAIEDADYDNSVIVKNDYKKGELPPEIQAGLSESFNKDAQKKNVSCVFRFKTTNDNRQLLGCKYPTSEETREKCGDDYYRTHSVNVGVNCSTDDGLTTSFSYGTELYSDPVMGSAYRDVRGVTHMKQKFTSENIFGVLQDNINKGEVTYWKRGVGFINLSEKKKWGLGQSTGQQEWFHNMINKNNPGMAYDYTYEEGSKDKWGPFVTLSIGLQENRKIGDSCKVTASADVGGRLSTLKDSSTLNLNLNGKISYAVSQNGAIYMRAESETVARRSSVVSEQSLAVGYERKSGGFLEIGVTKQGGNRKDVPDRPNILSGKNDLMVFLRAGYGFTGL